VAPAPAPKVPPPPPPPPAPEPPKPAPEAPKAWLAFAAARRFDEALAAAGADGEDLRLAKSAYEAALSALAKLPAGPLKTAVHEGRLRKATAGGLDFEDGVWLPSATLPAAVLEELLRKQRSLGDAERRGFEVLAKVESAGLPPDEREARELWTAAERDFPSMETRGAWSRDWARGGGCRRDQVRSPGWASRQPRRSPSRRSCWSRCRRSGRCRNREW
jgi:hypothetical protein